MATVAARAPGRLRALRLDPLEWGAAADASCVASAELQFGADGPVHRVADLRRGAALDLRAEGGGRGAPADARAWRVRVTLTSTDWQPARRTATTWDAEAVAPPRLDAAGGAAMTFACGASAAGALTAGVPALAFSLWNSSDLRRWRGAGEAAAAGGGRAPNAAALRHARALGEAEGVARATRALLAATRRPAHAADAKSPSEAAAPPPTEEARHGGHEGATSAPGARLPQAPPAQSASGAGERGDECAAAVVACAADAASSS